MACSFHHRGEFVPAISSIEILEKVQEPGFLVALREKGDGKGMACDGCQGLDVPLCIEYCQKYEDLEKILAEFLKDAELNAESQTADGALRRG